MCKQVVNLEIIQIATSFKPKPELNKETHKILRLNRTCMAPLIWRKYTGIQIGDLWIRAKKFDCLATEVVKNKTRNSNRLQITSSCSSSGIGSMCNRIRSICFNILCSFYITLSSAIILGYSGKGSTLDSGKTIL